MLSIMFLVLIHKFIVSDNIDFYDEVNIEEKLVNN